MIMKRADCQLCADSGIISILALKDSVFCACKAGTDIMSKKQDDECPVCKGKKQTLAGGVPAVVCPYCNGTGKDPYPECRRD